MLSSYCCSSKTPRGRIAQTIGCFGLSQSGILTRRVFSLLRVCKEGFPRPTRLRLPDSRLKTFRERGSKECQWWSTYQLRCLCVCFSWRFQSRWVWWDGFLGHRVHFKVWCLCGRYRFRGGSWEFLSVETLFFWVRLLRLFLRFRGRWFGWTPSPANQFVFSCLCIELSSW